MTDQTVESILASGQYGDTKDRTWYRSAGSGEWKNWNVAYFGARGRLWLTPAQMRRFIRMDQHRAECPGLVGCVSHPVPVVVAGEPHKWHRRKWKARAMRPRPRASVHHTLPAAMDAAIKLTEKENEK